MIYCEFSGRRAGPARLISNNPEWDRSESGQVSSSLNSTHKKHRQDRRATLANIGNVQVFSPVSLKLVRPILGIMQAMSLRGSRSDAAGAGVFRCRLDQNAMTAKRAERSMHASCPVSAGREERCAREAGRPGSQGRHRSLAVWSVLQVTPKSGTGEAQISEDVDLCIKDHLTTITMSSPQRLVSRTR